jgi:hypothetical protein
MVLRVTRLWQKGQLAGEVDELFSKILKQQLEHNRCPEKRVIDKHPESK